MPSVGGFAEQIDFHIPAPEGPHVAQRGRGEAFLAPCPYPVPAGLLECRPQELVKHGRHLVPPNLIPQIHLQEAAVGQDKSVPEAQEVVRKEVPAPGTLIRGAVRDAHCATQQAQGLQHRQIVAQRGDLNPYPTSDFIGTGETGGHRFQNAIVHLRVPQFAPQQVGRLFIQQRLGTK